MTVCFGVVYAYSKVGVALMWSTANGNLSVLYVETIFILFPDTF